MKKYNLKDCEKRLVKHIKRVVKKNPNRMVVEVKKYGNDLELYNKEYEVIFFYFIKNNELLSIGNLISKITGYDYNRKKEKIDTRCCKENTAFKIIIDFYKKIGVEVSCYEEHYEKYYYRQI